jgi:hypothetical protein
MIKNLKEIEENKINIDKLPSFKKDTKDLKKIKNINQSQDPMKRLMGQTQQLANVTEYTERSSKSSIKVDKSILDDSEFRKSHIKIEKIEIDCTPNKQRNMIKLNFDFDDNINNDDYYENSSNNLNESVISAFNLIAKEQIFNQCKETKEFLYSIGMEDKYMEIFIQKGFDKLEKILKSKI